jgi:hypothetical protein
MDALWFVQPQQRRSRRRNAIAAIRVCVTARSSSRQVEPNFRR